MKIARAKYAERDAVREATKRSAVVVTDGLDIAVKAGGAKSVAQRAKEYRERKKGVLKRSSPDGNTELTDLTGDDDDKLDEHFQGILNQVHSMKSSNDQHNKKMVKVAAAESLLNSSSSAEVREKAERKFIKWMGDSSDDD